MTDPRSNVFDMWPAPADMFERNTASLGRRCTELQPNLYDSLEERARIERAAEVARRELLQDRVKWGSLVVALVTVIYFVAEFLR